MGDGGGVTVDMLVEHLNKCKDMKLPDLAAVLIPEQNHGMERDDICLVMLMTK
jgi:hypothetical protein